ncbi:MAG: ATP-dependent DNA helicase RecG [Candidatus Omnitrophica bacterium]|nr:ATP-dependent DNA helicase RecG [Candidatus Omnitrophota bacterium]
MSRQPALAELSVQYVKGVGPARAQRLKRLAIESVADLLWTAPRRYEDRSRFVTIGALVPGEAVTIRVRFLEVEIRRMRTGRTLLQAAASDGTGTVSCVWFHQPYLLTQLNIGQEYILYGQAELAGRRLQFIHPELERLDPVAGGGELGLHIGRIVPMYPLTEGLNQRWFRTVVRAALDRHSCNLEEVLPAGLRERYHLPSMTHAIEQFHFPQAWDQLEQARQRLIFEELFLMQLRLALRRARWMARRKPRRYQPEGTLARMFVQRLPFPLTDSQQGVIEELVGDLRRPAPMLRLLQGDVGCGKTVVAAYATAVAVQSRYQAVWMAPTELLAQQHHRVLTEYLSPLGVRTGLLAQGVPAAERRALMRQVAEGTVEVVVGTHALIASSVAFARLGLVIIDEQHKFGVVQRSALARKAKEPDVLVMTATPIPRTLALSFYGDLACSTIAELPPGRHPVRTRWYKESDRLQVYEQIRQELRQGRQAYVVYPVIESKAKTDLKAAAQMAAHLKAHIFPGFVVELLHGQMRSAQQEAVMHGFADGRIQVLVSTVIVEVGLDVPNATVMLIEHPERFGLAQLHQLRGRIGRGPAPATCLLISDVEEGDACRRLQAFVEIRDGFQLAERDLQLRGPGELLGRQQHGWLRLQVADLTRDAQWLDRTRAEAFELVERNPELAGQEFAALRVRLRQGR